MCPMSATSPPCVKAAGESALMLIVKITSDVNDAFSIHPMIRFQLKQIFFGPC